MKIWNPRRRTFLTASGALLASGCYGSFGLTDMLYDWNGGIENKWARAAVFLALVIIPVYGLFLFVDAVVLNTIEFWTGNHPVQGQSVAIDDKRSVKSEATEDPDVVRHTLYEDGEPARTLYVRRINDVELHLIDADRRLLARALRRPDGSIEVFDPDGEPLTRIRPEQRARMERSVERGTRTSQAIYAELAGQPDGMLALRGTQRG